MSILQEYSSHTELIGKDRMKKLNDYCNKTGADYSHVMYSREGWKDFEKWANEN